MIYAQKNTDMQYLKAYQELVQHIFECQAYHFCKFPIQCCSHCFLVVFDYVLIIIFIFI